MIVEPSLSLFGLLWSCSTKFEHLPSVNLEWHDLKLHHSSSDTVGIKDPSDWMWYAHWESLLQGRRACQPSKTFIALYFTTVACCHKWLPYSGKLRERKLSWISRFLANRESFLRKIWERVVLCIAKATNPQNSSLRKLYFSLICESFLSWKFPLYGK